MSEPLVSVAIITYNQAEFIHETFLGTINQDYANLEIIVADDGSNDGTAQVIRDYAQKYTSKIVPVLSKQNKGITINCNRALEACHGKYISFQGGDDIFLPGKITTQVNWMEEDEERVLCGHDVEIFDSDTSKTIGLWSESKPLIASKGPSKVIRNGVPFPATSILVRKSALPNYGFDVRIPIVSDWKLWIDCLAGGGEYGFVKGIYAKYRRSEKNISRDVLRMIQSRLMALAIIESSHPEFIQDCAVQRSRAYYELGILLMKRAEYQLARNLFWMAIKVSGIRDIKLSLALLASILPRSWSQSFLVDRALPRKTGDYIQGVFRYK
jgi:glycosyltransferase involved in cell wall biosynthesis